MISDFSSGYYVTSMDIQEYRGGPVIQTDVYDFINKELYVDSTEPVLMRVGLDAGETFEVSAESAVPRDVLALPEGLITGRGEKDVFILKPEYSDSIGTYYG